MSKDDDEFNFEDEDAAVELDDQAVDKILSQTTKNDKTNITTDSPSAIKNKTSDIARETELIEPDGDNDFIQFDNILTSPLADKIGRQGAETQSIINELKSTINSADKIPQDDISKFIQLSKLQQSRAVNNIMFAFQTQNQSVQNTKEDRKYNQVERKLIREIQDQYNKLAAKTYQLNNKIQNGISYARIDKLEHRLGQLQEKHIKHIETKTEARDQDKGLGIEGAVAEYYTENDLKKILLQLKKADKEMTQLLKMPDVDKRCATLAKLCDAISALAKRSIFLIPQTIVAIGSVAEYAISTVMVDSVQQGFAAARTKAQDIREKISTRTPQIG